MTSIFSPSPEVIIVISILKLMVFTCGGNLVRNAYLLGKGRQHNT